MATITLRKSRFDNIQNVLDRLGASFKNYESSLNQLRHTAEGVDSNTCNLTDTIDKIASSSESEKDKVEKIRKLNKKIESFVNTAVQKERRARDEIVRKKNDFYKKYKNLKPDCEKGVIERAVQKYKEITQAINNWIIEHLDVIIAVVIVLVAVAVCIFCPAVIATLGIIVGAFSAVMGIVDIVCMATHGGKGIADLLEENGHGILAKIWSGTSMGFDIASIILPVGAGINAMKGTAKVTVKSALKNSAKNFIKHPLQTLKNGAKSLGSKAWNGIKSVGLKLKNFTLACKDDIFRTALSGMKSLGTKTLNGIKNVLGIDDIQKCYGLIKNGFQNGFSGQFGRLAYAYAADGIIDNITDNAVEEFSGKYLKSEVSGEIAENISGEISEKIAKNINPDDVLRKQVDDILSSEQKNLDIVKRDKNFNVYSKYDMPYDPDDIYDKVLNKFKNITFEDLENLPEGTDLHSFLNKQSRIIMHDEFLNRAKNNSAIMSQLKDLGVDISRVRKGSGLEKKLNAVGFVIHEDMAQHTMQIVPEWVNSLFKHDGDVSFITNAFFDADSRSVGSLLRKDACGNIVNASSSLNAYIYKQQNIKKLDSFINKYNKIRR